MALVAWSFKTWDFNNFSSECNATITDRLAGNLEVLLDFLLPIKKQVAVVVRRVFVQLSLMHQLWAFLDQECLCSVTQALVISHFDYCNVLHMGLP